MQHNPCRRRAIYAMQSHEAQASTISNIETVVKENDTKVCPDRETLVDLKREGKRSRARAINSN